MEEKKIMNNNMCKNCGQTNLAKAEMCVKCGSQLFQPNNNPFNRILNIRRKQ